MYRSFFLALISLTNLTYEKYDRKQIKTSSVYWTDQQKFSVVFFSFREMCVRAGPLSMLANIDACMRFVESVNMPQNATEMAL